MEFNDVVHNRRSIRRYQDRSVSDEQINALIQCAIEAPSWKNSQTARYHIVRSKEMLARVKAQALAPFNAVNSEDAPVLIVATFVKDHAGYDKTGVPSNEAGNLWGAYDLGLHNQNLLLKAVDLGLSTLVMGIRDAVLVRELLAIPENEIILSVIALGYGDIAPDMPKRKAIEEITTYY